MTKYDDESLRSIGIPDLLRNLEDALNIISYQGAEPLDFKTIKSRLFFDSETPRSFFSEKVVIENDLHFDDWSNTVKEDLDARRYLESFNLLYPKTQDPSVHFNIVGVSSLKRREYFYYNVLFESDFNNKDMDGNRFVSVRRLAEVRVEFDSAWVPYLNGIRFASSDYKLNDPKNDFTSFTEAAGRSTESKMLLMAKKREESELVQGRLDKALERGDELMRAGKPDEALEAYERALVLEPANETVRARIVKCEAVVRRVTDEKRMEEERSARISRLRSITTKNFKDHNFEKCKLAFDSLTVNYGVMDDELRMIGDKLAKLMPFINQMSIIEQQRDYELGLEYSTRLVRNPSKSGSSVDSMYVAEAAYWSARMYFDLDSLKAEDAAEYCKEALLFSRNEHLPSRVLLVKTRLYRKRNKLEALEIVTSMVNSEPRNPDLRALRGYVFEYLQDNESALKDYQLAVDLKTEDPSVYIRKSRLELSIGRFNAAASTAGAGLVSFPCDNELSYLRVFSQVKAGLYNSAGKDFQKSLACGFKGPFYEEIVSLARVDFDKGIVFFDGGNLDSAIMYFSRSYELAQVPDALFFRGYTLLKKGRTESALPDLNKLIQQDSTFQHAFYMRGLIKAAAGNHESAINDYKKQIELLPDYWKTYAACGRSAMLLNRYQYAGSCFELSNERKFTDSIASAAVEAYYRAGMYAKSITLARRYQSESRNVNGLVAKYLGLSEFKEGAIKAAEGDLQEALKAIPGDYETAISLCKVMLLRGDADRAARFAEQATLNCSYCGESVVWSCIAGIQQHRPESLDRHTERLATLLKSDTSLADAVPLAWLAYGYLIGGKGAAKYSPVLRRAQGIASDDPVVLFVQASAIADATNDANLSMDLLAKSFANGFHYYDLLDSDPNLKRFRNEPAYRELRQKYVR
ncbi:MAG: tetratricopeptide repeat protein [Bacteroidota bacterium]